MAAAVLAAVVLGGLGVLQVLVAAGRPHGRLVWGGRHEVLPRRMRIASGLSVPVYAAIAVLLIVRAAGPAASAVDAAAWGIAGYFALGIAVNGISRSRAERMVMTPTCALLAACAFVVASS